VTEQTLPIGPCEPAGPAAELARLMTASGACRYAGILLCGLGEDGEWLIAPGHVPDGVLAEAVTEYAGDENWWPGGDPAELPGRTRHRMARVIVRHADPDCGCGDCSTMATGGGDWYVDWSGGGTVPVTVVDWE
jgi:hypothetical protein